MDMALTQTGTTQLERSPADLDHAARGAFLGSKGNANTRAAYRRDLEALASFLDSLPEPYNCEPLRATRQHLDAWRQNMVESLTESGGAAYSSATIARRLSSASSFYSYCTIEGWLPTNPAQHVERPKVSDDSPTLGLDRAQLEGFYRAARDHSARAYALALVLAEQGLRISEALQLEAGEPELEQGHRVVRIKGKGGQRETVPLAPPVARAIEDLRLEVGDDGGPLFRTRSGKALDRHDAARLVQLLATRAGIPGRITPHSLRHTFVTLSLEAGVPLERVQDSARHSDPRTTRRYDQARGRLDNHAAYTLAGYITHPEEVTNAQ